MERQPKLSPIVVRELNKVKQRVLNKDRDFQAIVDGEEGVGKSVLAQQIAKTLDPDFDLDKIVFTSDDFLKIVKDPKTKKGTCIVLDEAFAAANNRSSLSEINKAMIGVATEMRQKNLFILYVIPSFFDLDRYFALWRSRALFHVYFTDNEDRNFIIFPKEEKKQLYLLGKKKYDYNKPRSPFPPFTFTGEYMVDEQEYRLKKANAFKKRTVSNLAKRWLEQRNAYIKYIHSALGLHPIEIGKIPVQYGSVAIGERGTQYVLGLSSVDDNILNEKEEETQENDVLDAEKAT